MGIAETGVASLTVGGHFSPFSLPCAQSFFLLEQADVNKHRVNSIPDYWLFKKMELINFELELKFPPKTFNPQINLPFNFLIQKYFFQDNLTWNINYSV